MSNKLLLLASSFLSLVALEAGLEQFGPVAFEMSQRQFIEGLGPWRAPNTKVPVPAYSTENPPSYVTNDLGMVETSRAADGANRVTIAFLGDSMIEGLAVSEERRVTELVEEICPQSLRVNNFASSGIGTIQELAVYSTLVRASNPDVVVLGLFPANDIANNSRELQIQLGDTFLSQWIWGSLESDSLVLHNPTPVTQPRPPILRRLMPASYAHLWVLKQRILHRFSKSGSAMAEGAAGYLEVYNPKTESRQWKAAWDLTEQALLHLRDLVTQDSARFVVAILPDPAQAYDDPIGQLEIETGHAVDPDVDVFYPHLRLEHFLQENHIEYVPLFRQFDQYRRTNRLQPPYFGFPTDGHWNPLGHQVAAASLNGIVASYCQPNTGDSLYTIGH